MGVMAPRATWMPLLPPPTPPCSRCLHLPLLPGPSSTAAQAHAAFPPPPSAATTLHGLLDTSPSFLLHRCTVHHKALTLPRLPCAMLCHHLGWVQNMKARGGMEEPNHPGCCCSHSDKEIMARWEPRGQNLTLCGPQAFSWTPLV